MDPEPIQLPSRRLLPHGRPHWAKDDAIYFITICCQNRGPNQLCIPDVADTILEAIEFRASRDDWYVHLLLPMPDHIHGLISFPVEKSMRTVVANFKEIVAKKTGVQWQRDFFDHRLRKDESYEEKALYIRMNPVMKNLTAIAADWSYVWEPR